MDPVIVVGAGIAGISCANELTAQGVDVHILDRGHRAGGRMAVRRLEGRPVDLGASYFTVDDDDFARVVAEWQDDGLAREWTDRFCVLDEGPPSLKEGPMRMSAPGGLRTLVEDLGRQQAIKHEVISDVRLVNGRWMVNHHPASAVVLAMPDEQAARLVNDARKLPGRVSEPVMTAVAWFGERTWDQFSPDGVFHGAFTNADPTLDFIIDDGRRRGDDQPILVAHSTSDFARGHLQRPEGAQVPMIAALRELLDLSEPRRGFVKRWAFARPTGERTDSHRLDEDLLGWCGDGWGDPPRVQTAWLSGRALASDLANRLPG